MTRVRTASALALLAPLAACAPAGGGLVQDPGKAASPARVVAALPAELSAFRRQGEITDYARTPGGAGLGASARYVPSNGERMLATVYLYDRGARRAPDGGTSPDVAAEVRSTAGEIQAMVAMGRYRASAFASGMDVSARDAPGTTEMRCATFRVVQGDGAPTGDAVCVSIQGGLFVKTRVTTWQPADPTAAGLVAAGLQSAVLGARRGV